MRLDYKAVPFAVKEMVDVTGGGWEIAGFASTWGDPPDAYGDVIVPGAFAESIGARQTKFLYEHREPIGRQLELREDAVGLFGRWAIVDTNAGTDAYKLAKAGVLDSLSIGYTVDESEYRDDGVRLLKRLTLYEVSAVAIPANERALITDVKATWSTSYVNDLRALVAKAVRAGLEYLLPTDLAPIKEPVMIGAKHDDILDIVCAAMFPGRDVADIIGCFLPATDRAAVKKLLADHRAKGVSAAVDAIGRATTLHGSTVADALAATRAVSGVRARRFVVGELLAADDARLREFRARLAPATALTKDVVAGEPAESGASDAAIGGDDIGLSALLADLGWSHKQIIPIKAVWSAAFINSLPDSSFALILPGGEKDESGKTTPRSLRKLPHHDGSGSLDAAHVRNGLSRAPQMTGVSDSQRQRAIGHLQKHLDGMSKAAEHDHEPAIDLRFELAARRLRQRGILESVS